MYTDTHVVDDFVRTRRIGRRVIGQVSWRPVKPGTVTLRCGKQTVHDEPAAFPDRVGRLVGDVELDINGFRYSSGNFDVLFAKKPGGRLLATYDYDPKG